MITHKLSRDFPMENKIRVSLCMAFFFLFFSGSAQDCLAAVQGEAGREVSFLFDTLSWLLFAAAFTGILLGGLIPRTDPYIDKDRVWRHDLSAKFSHWTHAGGCILLLVSAVGLGFFFLPRLVPGVSGAAWLMDLHFIGALLFVFGGFFWAANTIISPYRFTEHMPDGGSLIEGLTHYAHIFKLTQKRVRPTKYNGSERLAFVPIVLVAALLILTGFIKILPRMMDIPTALLASSTWVHDASALFMLILFFFHVLLAAVVPWSWPLLKSMFTGHVSLEFAQDEHASWVEQLNKKDSTEEKS